MKKIFDSLLLFSALLLVSVYSAAAENFFQLTPQGAIRAGELTFQVTHWDKQWNISRPGSGNFLPGKNSPEMTAERDTLEGQFRTGVGIWEIREILSRESPGHATLSISLRAEKGIPTNSLVLEALLPVPLFETRPILADGKPIQPKSGTPADAVVRLQNVRTLSVTLGEGVLELSGDLDILLQNNRRFGANDWGLRIRFAPGSGEPTSSQLKIGLSYLPFRQKFIDFGKAANMGFTDDVSDDHKGGWTDQGADNDLRQFPVGRQTFSGIEFNIADPAANGGTGCIVLKGKERPGFPVRAEIALDRPTAARYLYCLQAVAWEPGVQAEVGEIVCEYADQTAVADAESHFRVRTEKNIGNFWMPRPLPEAGIAWKHHNPSADVGLFLTRFDLTGAPVSKIRFEGNGSVVWMIAGATLSDRRDDSGSDLRTVIRSDGENYFPISNPGPVKRGSILDFSGLLDAPAGKYGSVRANGGRFVFEKRPGVPIRFYGANIAFSVNFMEDHEIDKMADEFAAAGYNLVRFHHFDGILTGNGGLPRGKLDPVKLERMDALLAAFRERGVYATLDLYSARTLEPGEVPAYPDRRIGGSEYKALAFIDENVMHDWENFARNFLCRKNSRTGIEWKDDPAIVSISLINEDAIFACATGIPWIRELYRKRFDAWLSSRENRDAAQDREALWLKFLAETYNAGYRHMKDYLRGLGVKALLTDQNFWNDPATTVLRNQYDFADNHFYWGHPVFFQKSWSLPATVGAESSIFRCAGGLNRMFATRIYGKPFSVSEWDYVNPNGTGVEGAFLVGAYASLQDWSALCRFAYSHDPKRIRDKESRAVFFDCAGDPLRLLSERAGVVAFLRGDVAAATAQFPFVLGLNFFDSAKIVNQYPTPLERLGLIGGTGTLPAIPGKPVPLPAGTRAILGNVPGWTPGEFSVPYFSFAGEAASAFLEQLARQRILTPEEYRPGEQIFRSSTGELTLNADRGTFLCSTVRSESMVLPEGASMSGKFLSVSNRRGFAAFLAAATDDRPVQQSGRILLLHLTHVLNTEQTFRDPEKTILEAWGNTPLLIFRGEAEIKLTGEFTGYRLYAIDFDGSRLFPVAVERRGGKLCFRAETISRGKAVAAYELVDEHVPAEKEERHE